MDQKLKQAIRKIEEGGWLEILEACATLEARYIQLMVILPEVWFWDTMRARKLVFYLQRKHGLNFGVCDFYEIAMNEDKQYCDKDGKKVECICVIPEPYCIFRDPKGKPKYPELMEIFALSAEN